VWPKEASPASKSTSEVTLIALYDVGVHVAISLLMALFQRFWRWLTVISRA
jgi:hypothetical protein